MYQQIPILYTVLGEFQSEIFFVQGLIKMIFSAKYPLVLFEYSCLGHWHKVRVFANGPGDLGSIPAQVIPKTQQMVLDATLLNTQHYNVRIKGKVEQSRARSFTLLYTLV